MSASTRIAAFVALLLVVFAVSLWVGGAVGPRPGAAVPQPATSNYPRPAGAGR